MFRKALGGRAPEDYVRQGVIIQRHTFGQKGLDSSLPPRMGALARATAAIRVCAKVEIQRGHCRKMHVVIMLPTPHHQMRLPRRHAHGLPLLGRQVMTKVEFP